MLVERDIEIALCVFREANDALIVFDPRNGQIIDVNPTALRLTGFDKKAALSRTIGDFLSSTDRLVFDQFLDACQRTRFFHSKEGYDLSRKDGPSLPINLTVSRIHTHPDPLALAMIRDISGRKKVEEELRQARDELESKVEQRTAELLKAKEVAEAAGRVRDRFLAVLSHELRTPLTPVLAVVSSLLDNPETSESLRPTLDMIRRSITLEARLIDDLLDLTRFEQRRVQLDREPVDARTLLDQAIEICQAEVDAAQVRITLEFPSQARIVEADAPRFLQVACHLILNALKSAEPGGTIVVQGLDSDDGRLVFSVIDDGRGIEPEDLASLFESFDQGDSPNWQGMGLGIGLMIARSIVEAHGGTLSASSEGLGRGSTFTFDMPCLRLEEPTASEPTTLPPDNSTSDRPGYKILLVEDHRDVLRYLKLALEIKGHQVTATNSLTSARELLDQPFDLLISDIQLADGTGHELMRELRGKISGLAISGYGAPDDIQMSLDAGFTMHLTKPVEIGRLEAAIQKVMDTIRDRSI
jgi:two-component system CheB/CheR fusion protein